MTREPELPFVPRRTGRGMAHLEPRDTRVRCKLYFNKHYTASAPRCRRVFLPWASARADDEILPPQSQPESISAPAGRFIRPAFLCPNMTRGFFFRSDFPDGYSAASE